jgi:hypothetical protein
MTTFEKASFTEREKELGDTAEGKFEEWAARRGVILVRLGFNRPPFRRFYDFDERLRLFPDYAAEGAKESILVEVKGCGKEGLKIKDQSISVMDFWNDLVPVRIFVWNSSLRKCCLLAFDELVSLLEGKEAMKFPDGKVYRIVDNNDLTWTDL